MRLQVRASPSTVTTSTVTTLTAGAGNGVFRALFMLDMASYKILTFVAENSAHSLFSGPNSMVTSTNKTAMSSSKKTPLAAHNAFTSPPPGERHRPQGPDTAKALSPTET